MTVSLAPQADLMPYLLPTPSPPPSRPWIQILGEPDSPDCCHNDANQRAPFNEHHLILHHQQHLHHQQQQQQQQQHQQRHHRQHHQLQPVPAQMIPFPGPILHQQLQMQLQMHLQHPHHLRPLHQMPHQPAAPPPPPPPPPQAIFRPAKQCEPEFTVLSYNVLCDRMVNTDMFPESPKMALDWEYRRHLIMGQLLGYNADVFALQELEIGQFERYFKPQLKLLGNYDAIFAPKSRIRTTNLKRRERVDGCAIFYKTEKFKLIEQHLIEFTLTALANSESDGAMLNRVMPKDNIGIAAVLEFSQLAPEETHHDIQAQLCNPDGHIHSHHYQHHLNAHLSQQQQPPKRARRHNHHHNHQHPHNPTANCRACQQQGNNTALPRPQRRRILVSTTHLHWDPQFPDVKLVQTIMLSNELKSIAREHIMRWQKELGRSICGDFIGNSKNGNTHRDNDNHNRCSSTSRHSSDNDSRQHRRPATHEIAHLLPLVLMGDFNSLPDSGVVSFLKDGAITSRHNDFRKFRYHKFDKTTSQKIRDPTRAIHVPLNELPPPVDINYSTLQLRNNRRLSAPATYYQNGMCFYDNSNSSFDDAKSSSPSSSTSGHSPPQFATSFVESARNGGARLVASPSTCTTVMNSPPTSGDEGDSTDADPLITYRHPFALASAYEDIMPYTNYTTKFKAVIDYIFFSRDSIQSLGVLGPVDLYWLSMNSFKGFPQPNMPSDHLPLLVRMRLKCHGTGSNNNSNNNNYQRTSFTSCRSPLL